MSCYYKFTCDIKKKKPKTRWNGEEVEENDSGQILK